MAAPTLAWVGTVAFDASTGTHDPTYPASGVTSGDAIYVVNVNKDGSGSADPGDPTPAAGWTKVGSGFGGTGTAGAGTGPVHVTVWRRNTDADGTENGAAVGINLDNPGSGVGRLGMANVFGVRPAAGGTLSEGWASGQDATIGTDYSATMGTDPGIAADDLAVAFAGLDNQATTSFSAESITATGCTFGTVTEDDEHSTSSGNDIRMVVWDAPCTAGPSSAAATIAATSAGNVSGVGALMRVRESAAATNAPAGVAAGTGTAADATVALSVPAGNAAASGVAADATAAVGATAGLAAGTGAGQDAAISVGVPAGAATAAGVALDPTVQTGVFTSAPAGLAAGSGAAQAPAVAVAPPAGNAAATGSANDATVQIGQSAPAGLAAAAGTASDATASVAALAGLAAATGSANDATVTFEIVYTPGGGVVTLAIPAGVVTAAAATGAVQVQQPAETVAANTPAGTVQVGQPAGKVTVG